MQSRTSMMNILKDIFSEKNIVVISITSVLYQVFIGFWATWWTLYLLELGATIPIVGLLSMIQNSSNILFQLPGGMLADRIGRKKTIMIGTGMRIFAPIIMYLGNTWQQVTPGIIVNAAASLYIPGFNAIIAESLPHQERGTAFGAYRMITGAPSIFMPIISGIYIDQVGLTHGVRVGLLMYIFVAIIAFAGRACFLRETLVNKDSSRNVQKPTTSRGAFSTFLGLRGMIPAMLVIAVVGGFSTRMSFSFLVIYATEVMGLRKTQWGILQTAFTAVSIPFFLFGGIIADRFGRVPCVLVARALFPLNSIALLLTRNFNLLLGIQVILGIGGGLGGGNIQVGGFMGGPSWQALIADVVPSKDRGKVLGLMATLTGLVGLPAPTIGALVWETYTPSALLITSTVIACIALPLIPLYIKEPKTREK